MKTKFLNREQYLASVTQMTHFESLKFAKQSLDWWDTYYSWSQFPCLCLQNNGKKVCYLFYHISKDNKYLTIHNLLTPHPHRFNGYAKILLTLLFTHLFNHNSPIQRVKMICVSSSLSFYMKLGVDFWGVNELGQYYTNFPMPDTIEDIPLLMKNETLKQLPNEELQNIYDKLKINGKQFDLKETIIFHRSLDMLGKRYRFEELKKLLM